MRKNSFDFGCFSSLVRFGMLFCLGVLLLFPVSVYARSRHAHHRHYRTHRVHQHGHAHVRHVAESHTSDRAGYRSYRVRRGDTLTSIAGNFGTTSAELRRSNHLRSNRIQAGHTLYVPVPSSSSQGERRMASAERPRSYRVRPGDTLNGIAARFGMSVAALRRSNHLPTSRIVAGQRLDLSGASRHEQLASTASRMSHRGTAAEASSTTASLPPVPTQSANLSRAGQTAESADAVEPQPVAMTRGAVFQDTSVPRSMPAALFGTHEILVHQNIVADVEGLQRIQNSSQLRQMVRDGDLVALPVSSGLIADPRLPASRRYCRSWTAKFLTDLARAHERLFGRSLRVTSAVRTAHFQRRLSYRNANAAPVSGDIASPHLTGEAIDIGKKGMSRHEIAWMREVLGKLQAAGKLDVEEEFHQACFHISVYKTYVPGSRVPERMIASEKSPSTAAELAGETDQNATLRPANESAARSKTRRVRREPARRRTRRAVERRHRRHRSTVSLLAAGIH